MLVVQSNISSVEQNVLYSAEMKNIVQSGDILLSEGGEVGKQHFGKTR
jgi:hypothetical protein